MIALAFFVAFVAGALVALWYLEKPVEPWEHPHARPLPRRCSRANPPTLYDWRDREPELREAGK